MFLSFFKHSKNQIRVFLAFLACKKLNPSILSFFSSKKIKFMFFKLANEYIHAFWVFSSSQKWNLHFKLFKILQEEKSTFLEPFQACKKLNSCFFSLLKLEKNYSCFLSFFNLAKIEIHVFWAFVACKNESHVFWAFSNLQKINWCLLSFLKFLKNQMHVFLALLSLKKKFTFF